MNDQVQIPQLLVSGCFSLEPFSFSSSSAGGWASTPVPAAKQGKGFWQPPGHCVDAPVMFSASSL